jgi:hypothetical protein
MWVSVSLRISLLYFWQWHNQFLLLLRCAGQWSMDFGLLHVSAVLVTEVSPSPRQRGYQFGQ